jgi:hypothetical protein
VDVEEWDMAKAEGTWFLVLRRGQALPLLWSGSPDGGEFGRCLNEGFDVPDVLGASPLHVAVIPLKDYASLEVFLL